MLHRIVKAYIDWDEPFEPTKTFEAINLNIPGNALTLQIFEKQYYIDHFVLPTGDSNITEFYLLSMDKAVKIIEEGYNE